MELAGGKRGDRAIRHQYRSGRAQLPEAGKRTKLVRERRSVDAASPQRARSISTTATSRISQRMELAIPTHLTEKNVVKFQ
jgi:hypothetical protein